MSEHLTVAQAAERLGVSAATVRRKASLGELDATREGRAWMINLDDSADDPSPDLSEPDTGSGPAIGTVVGSRSYWCGTLPGSPLQNINIAGLDFPAFIELIDHPAGTIKTQRTKVRGTVVSLDDSQVKAAHAAATRKVIRTSGARISLLSVDSRFYRKTVGDQPIGAYLYMMEVEDAVDQFGAMWRDAPNPQPLIG